MPWVAATTFRQYRGGSDPRSHGDTWPAATYPYRIRPIASTQAPTGPTASTLSTRMRKASTSRSNRAPSAEAVPVRRATQPSTASRDSATTASGTTPTAGTPRTSESTTSASTPPTSVARASVTRSAGPSTTACSTPQVTTPYARPAAQAAAPRPMVAATAASTATWVASPSIGPLRTVGTVPPSPWGVLIDLYTGADAVRFARGGHR